MFRSPGCRYVFISDTTEFTLTRKDKTSSLPPTEAASTEKEDAVAKEALRGLEVRNPTETAGQLRVFSRGVFRAPSISSSVPSSCSEDEEEEEEGTVLTSDLVDAACGIEDDIRRFELEELNLGFSQKDSFVNIQNDLTMERTEKIMSEIRVAAGRQSLKKSANIKPRRASMGAVWSGISQTRLEEISRVRQLEDKLVSENERDARLYDSHVESVKRENYARLKEYRTKRLTFEKEQVEKLVRELGVKVEGLCANIKSSAERVERVCQESIEVLTRELKVKTEAEVKDKLKGLSGSEMKVHSDVLLEKLDGYEKCRLQAQSFVQKAQALAQACNAVKGKPSEVSTVDILEGKCSEANDVVKKLHELESTYGGAAFEKFKNETMEKVKAMEKLQAEQKEKQNQEKKEEVKAQPAAAAVPATPAQRAAVVNATAKPTGGAKDVQASSDGGVSVPDITKASHEKHFKFIEGKMKEMDAWLKDKSFGRQRIDCKKKVNTNINTISATIPQVLQKINNLNELLKVVKENTMGYMYTKDIIATKLVDQGDSQVHVHTKSAFPIAAVCVGIMVDCPEIKDDVLSHFASKCSYIDGYYILRPSGMDDSKYKEILGYKTDPENDEAFESEEKYFERMSGVVSLFAAIVQTEWKPNGAQENLNPVGIDFGWRWLSRVLNQQPRKITPSLLLSFLEVCGYKLYQEYGNQFKKIMNFIVTDFLKRLDKKGAMGSVTRLEMFLEKCISSGNIPVPDGKDLSID